MQTLTFAKQMMLLRQVKAKSHWKIILQIKIQKQIEKIIPRQLDKKKCLIYPMPKYFSTPWPNFPPHPYFSIYSDSP